MNATWPFARLTVSSSALTISGLLLGSYTFSINDVADLRPYGRLPLLGRGIQIIHINKNYPAKLIFWCFGKPERLIEQIHTLGFQPSATQAAATRKQSGIPLRWSFVITIIAAWNILFLLNGFEPWDESEGPGINVFLALLMLFFTSVAATRFPVFQSIITKPGRSISEIKPVFNLLILISGLMLLALTVQYFFQQ